ISNHVICPMVHRKETLGASLGSLYSHMAGMINPANGMPTNAALFPQGVDAACHPVRFDFGNFLATGPVGANFAPFVPGGNSTMQPNMRLNIEGDRLEERRQLLNQLDGIKRQLDTSGSFDAMDHIQTQAVDIILRGASDAFDLSKESDRTVARYDTAPLVRPE